MIWQAFLKARILSGTSGKLWAYAQSGSPPPLSSATLATRVIASYCSCGSSISTKSIRQPRGTKTPNSTATRNLLGSFRTHHTLMVYAGTLPSREGGFLVGVASDDKEQVGEAVCGLEGVGVRTGVASGGEAALRAAHHRAGDV